MPMPSTPIRLLTPDTVGKIAAGETVERPVSVVKELLENALDAGARRVRVAVREGGTGLIEVADDGRGIPPAELPLAVQRHATSKLAAFEDLDALATLGFRGEALPSIGAVGDLSIRSRPHDLPHGTAIRVAFGAVSPPEPVAAAPGTVVTVRDLFANVPARKKFLRQAGTEAGYAVRAVGAYAAAYPQGRHRVGRRRSPFLRHHRFRRPRRRRPGNVRGGGGRGGLPLRPLEESAAVPGVVVEGWVGGPSVTRSHRQGIVLFVNGRWVQHRALSFALEEAYHSLLMVGRHPVAVVHLKLDPAAVDVNVHPTKAEVKFVDERAACRALSRSVHAALSRAPRAALPHIRFEPPAERPRQIEGIPAWAPQAEAERPAAATDIDPAPSPAANPSGVPVLRVLGQVGGSFIIAEGPDGMYLIDQHAAHERVMYEKILAGMDARDEGRQPLLDPLVVDLSPDELAAYEKSAAELAAVGWEIEPFAAGAVAVRAVPAPVRRVDIGERLHLILRELAEGGTGDSWQDAVAISTACHTSIRAGQALSLAEMRELVAELERSSQPRACGHGGRRCSTSRGPTWRSSSAGGEGRRSGAVLASRGIACPTIDPPAMVVPSTPRADGGCTPTRSRTVATSPILPPRAEIEGGPR
jgi:DNA mismatch repair protein MutL